jgi:hypothetical protein
MARVLVLCQTKNPDVPKLQVRGTFSQKKKLWEVLGTCGGPQVGWKIVDDVSEKQYDLSYSTLCNRLRLTGRATILNAEGKKIFLVVNTEKNVLRDWDTGEDGKPVLNPVKGEEDAQEGE